MTDLLGLGSEPYVSLTTFRRSGEPVATPVWVGVDGATLVVTTVATTGKVRRIRHTPEVTLRPCTRTGEVAADAPTVAARAEVVDDPAEVRRLSRVLTAKYGVLARLFLATDRLSRRRQRVMLRIAVAA